MPGLTAEHREGAQGSQPRQTLLLTLGTVIWSMTAAPAIRLPHRYSGCCRHHRSTCLLAQPGFHPPPYPTGSSSRHLILGRLLSRHFAHGCSRHLASWQMPFSLGEPVKMLFLWQGKLLNIHSSFIRTLSLNKIQ